MIRLPVSPKARLYIISSFVSIGGFLVSHYTLAANILNIHLHQTPTQYGLDNGIVSSCLIMPSFQKTFGVDNPADVDGIAAMGVAHLAAIFSALTTGYFIDRLGRKKIFYIASIVHIIGSILQVVSTNLAVFLVGRAINGISLGIYSLLIPLYQSELATATNRGRMITIYQIGSTMGSCVAFWMCFGTYYFPRNIGWKLPMVIQIIPPLLMLAGLWAIPESPRWLIYRERFNEAKYILEQLRDNSDGGMDVRMEYTGIVQDVTFDKIYTKNPYTALFQTGTTNYKKRTFLGIGIHALTQLTGINALLYYLPDVLEAAGIKYRHTALIGNCVGGSVSFLATIPLFFYIDRVDRRLIMTLGAVVVGCALVVIASVTAQFAQRIVSDGSDIYQGMDFTSTTRIHNEAATYVILVFLIVFFTGFSLSWGSMGWVYPAEIYPQLIRANAMGVTTASSYLFNLIITIISPIMFRNILWGTYIFFAIFCFIIVIVVRRFYPETRVSRTIVWIAKQLCIFLGKTTRGNQLDL
ncbi:general substrate transporter [Phycomyces nitens]|nr:general substrate transporter [Phycomyces nitens]